MISSAPRKNRKARLCFVFLLVQFSLHAFSGKFWDRTEVKPSGQLVGILKDIQERDPTTRDAVPLPTFPKSGAPVPSRNGLPVAFQVPSKPSTAVAEPGQVSIHLCSYVHRIAP